MSIAPFFPRKGSLRRKRVAPVSAGGSLRVSAELARGLRVGSEADHSAILAGCLPDGRHKIYLGGRRCGGFGSLTGAPTLFFLLLVFAARRALVFR